MPYFNLLLLCALGGLAVVLPLAVTPKSTRTLRQLRRATAISIVNFMVFGWVFVTHVGEGQLGTGASPAFLDMAMLFVVVLGIVALGFIGLSHRISSLKVGSESALETVEKPTKKQAQGILEEPENEN